MKHQTAAKSLSELGHDTRLAIFRLAVKAGDEGLPVGRIQAELGASASTLSHHIHRLVSVDLLTQRREGRILHCVANLSTLREVMTFLESQCCTLPPQKLG